MNPIQYLINCVYCTNDSFSNITVIVIIPRAVSKMHFKRHVDMYNDEWYAKNFGVWSITDTFEVHFFLNFYENEIIWENGKNICHN